MSLGAHVTFPWPWPTDSVDEILLRHALEHIGESTETFLRIMQELYRVCRHSAVINIFVPHPRHDDFLNDPTYVRPIMPTMFEHFSLKKNIEWDRLNGANTRLARITGTNFEMEKSKAYLDSPWSERLQSGQITTAQVHDAMREHNNVVKEIEIVLRVVKA